MCVVIQPPQKKSYGWLPGFTFVVISSRLYFIKQCMGFLRQPLLVKKNINRLFKKLPLQSLPPYRNIITMLFLVMFKIDIIIAGIF